MPGFMRRVYSRFGGRLLLLGVLALLLSAAGGGGPPVAGAEGTVVSEESYPQGIVCDQTWTPAGSPYTLASSVLVPSGCYLVISPGVEVRFNDGLGMQVDGTLIARGTASSPITFTTSRASPTAGSWGYIKFTDTATDATFDPPEAGGNYTGGSILQYATVQYAGSTGNGAIWLDYAAPFIDHCTIRNNNRSGVYAQNSNALRVTNNFITGNSILVSMYGYGYGGGIYVLGTVTIAGNTITSNSVSVSRYGYGYGGGIFASGTVTITGNTITSNSVPGQSSDPGYGYGGGIFATGGTATIANNTITNNFAHLEGGGIYASGTVTITGNTITNNSIASSGGRPGWGNHSGGGGLYTEGGTATISGNTITANSAQEWGSAGGGIYSRGTTMALTNNTIADNTATGGYVGEVHFGGGGGVYAHGGVLTISGNTIANNSSSAYGGISVANGTTYITNNIISGNVSSAYGGGIEVEESIADISGNIIAYNNSSGGLGYGGGIYAYGGTVTISGNTIANNTASGWGGGLFLTGGSVSRNSIVRNAATDPNGSGGAHLYNVTSFSNNTVVSNTAPSRGGLTVDSNPPTTFSGNNLVNGGYELSNLGSSSATATNNWWGTTSTAAIDAEIYDFFDDAGKGIVTYSPYLIAPADCAPPSPPTGLRAISGTNQIALSWLANPEADIVGYKVCYDTDSGFPYASVITVGNTTAYTVTRLTEGITYYLAVTAYDTSGDESWYSEEVSAVPLAPPPSGNVAGHIDLQGRSDDGGALVTLASSSTYTTTTAAGGTFTITDVAAGTYTAIASMPGYLSAQRRGVVVADGMTTTLPTVRLLGGDADRDNDIDIYDLTLLGASFGMAVPPADPRADITGDGMVNIFDIVLVGANYGLAAPRPWP